MTAASRLRRRRSRLPLLGILAAVALVLAACGGDDDDPTLSGAPGTEESTDTTAADDDGESSGESDGEVVIEMTDALKFSPQEATVKVGDTVTWDNPSTVVHTATADPDKVADPDNVSLPEGAEPWDSGFVQPGESFSHTFTEPGTYEYVCIPHEGVGMAGTIVVEE